MDVLRYVFIAFTVLAGISVLRNPLKVWPNTLAGLSYFVGAAGALLFSSRMSGALFVVDGSRSV